MNVTFHNRVITQVMTVPYIARKHPLSINFNMTYGTIGAVEVRHLAPKKVYFALYLGKKLQNYYAIFLAGKVRDC